MLHWQSNREITIPGGEFESSSGCEVLPSHYFFPVTCSASFRTSALANEVSNGNFDVPKISVKGSHDVCDLAIVQSDVRSMVRVMLMLES
jgi:hypothetical protein